MTRKATLAVTIAALLTPAVAGALGLGNIQVSSALNEPLQARIDVRGASSEDFGNLRARLGSQEQFERAGFDRPFILTKLRFKVVETGSSSGYIQVTSKGPVAEPFLNFLLDVTWSSGRVIREYTLLLDPPVYGAAISSTTQKRVTTVATMPAASVPAPAPKVQTTTAVPSSGAVQATPDSGGSYGPVKDGETLWSIATAVRPSTAVSIQAMMLAILKANTEAFIIDNVNALRTGAVLRIPAASELRQGKAEALTEVARQHGLWREYRQSIGAPVAEPAASGQVAAKAPVAAESVDSTGTTAAQDGSGSGELKLLAGSSQGSGSGTGSSEELQSLRDELSMAREQADAAKNENQELKERLNKVESIVTDLNRLVDLKEDQLAALQTQLAEGQGQAEVEPVEPKAEEPVVEEPKAEEPVVEEPKAEEPVVEEPKAEEPVVEEPKAEEPKPQPPLLPPPQPTSTLDMINGLLPVPLWSVLAGLGAILLGFGGLGFMRKRRAASETASGPVVIGEGESMISAYAATEVPDVDDDDLLDAEAMTEVPDAPDALDMGSEDMTDVPETSATASIDTTEMPAEEVESTGKMAAMEPTGPTDDPLAEFNVYLAYESFDQAEQLARNAIAGAPDRHEYKSKLLEVFYASKNIPAYESAAKDLHEAVGDDHELMVQARGWWSDMSTGRELFATGDGADVGSATGDDVFDVTASDVGGGTGTNLDFDLGVGSESDGGESDSAADSGLDFDLGSLDDLGPADGGGTEAVAKGETDLDFDLGSLDDSGSEAGGDSPEVLDSGTDLDFDLGSLDETDAASAGGEGAAAGDSGLDFDLGGLGEADESSEPSPEAGEDEGMSLDFDLGDTSALDDGVSGAATEVGEDQSLDFDLGGLGDAPAGQTEDSVDAGADTDDQSAGMDLDFDLGGLGDAPAAEAEVSVDVDAGTDDQGADMDLDFDLSDTMAVGDALSDAGADDQQQSTTAEMDTGLDLDLGMDLDTTGGDIGAAPEVADDALESSLDMDLGAIGGADEAGESGLDLDLDLGATGDTQPEVADEAGESGLDLDLDLGAIGGDGETQIEIADETGGSGLDLDLGIDFEAIGDNVDQPVEIVEEAQDTGLDLELDLGSVIEEGTSTDTELPDLSDPGSELDFQDAATEIGDVSDPELMQEMGIEMPAQEQPAPFETVKLDADDVSKMSLGNSTDLDISLDASDAEPGFGVDTEFKSIFSAESADEANDGAASSVDFDLGGDFQDSGIGDGTSSSVDFDLSADFESDDADSALADIFEVGADSDSAAEDEVDLDVTVFSLPDLPTPPSADQDADDEEDRTLVLGRSAGNSSVDDMQTKLDLAQAYMETGDTEGARNLLGEVMAEGSELQQATAREMLTKLS